MLKGLKYINLHNQTNTYIHFINECIYMYFVYISVLSKCHTRPFLQQKPFFKTKCFREKKSKSRQLVYINLICGQMSYLKVTFSCLCFWPDTSFDVFFFPKTQAVWTENSCMFDISSGSQIFFLFTNTLFNMHFFLCVYLMSNV